MKKIHLILSLFFLFAFANFSFGQIIGSGHDFSGNAWANNRICIVCHTPHNGTAMANAPLWNRELSATATYTMYSSLTFDGAASAVDPIATSSSNSRLCLSCHDGTVALENFGGVTTGTTFITGSANIGTDLSNDHPISFTYDDALSTTDPGLWQPSTTAALGGTIQSEMLFGDQLECASCHNVHDNTNGFFLRMDNTGSALCLTCHNK
ncbi:MAG: cytochrome c3 family protein [Bacteroidota bacterium]